MKLAKGRKETVSLPLVNNVKLGIMFASLAGVKGRAHREAEQSVNEGEETEGKSEERRNGDKRRDERRLERKKDQEEISDLKRRVGKKVIIR